MISMEEFLKRQQSEVDMPRRPNATVKAALPKCSGDI